MDPVQAIRLSLCVGLWCTVLGFPVALFFGWLLSRRRFPGRVLLNVFLFIPLALPPVVTGYLLLALFGRTSLLGGLLGRIGLPVTFNFAGAVLAALIVGLPLYIMAVRAAIDSVDRRYEELAWTLGTPPWKAFSKVTVPLALPGIAAGAVLAFARALGEFGATVVLAGNMEGETRTIALAVYALLDAPDGMAKGRPLIVASLVISFVSLLGYELLLKWQERRTSEKGMS